LIAYFDTSAMVPIVIEESTSEVAARLWDAAERVVSSRLIYVEARAALSLAHRMGRLDARSRREAVRSLDVLVADLDVVEVTDMLVRHAGMLAESQALGCYDAIHLASAELVNDGEVVLVTGDQDLIEAAVNLGLGTANLHGASSSEQVNPANS